MGVNVTVIPSDIDLADEVDQTSIDYQTTGDKTDKVLTVSKGMIERMAANDLRLNILEVATAVSGATSDFSDIFSDTDGLLNTVDAGNTTSVYDATNDYYENISVTAGSLTTTQAGNATSGEFTYLGTKDIYAKTWSAYSTSYSGTTTLTITNEDDGGSVVFTGAKTFGSGGASIQTWTINKTLEAGVNYKFAWSGTSTLSKRTGDTLPSAAYFDFAGTAAALVPYNTGNAMFTWDLIETVETDLSLNYNKGKPANVYLYLWSADDSEEDIGTCTFELINTGTSETTGDLNPFEITALNMTDIPDQLLIKQTDVERSKIFKYVLLVEEV